MGKKVGTYMSEYEFFLCRDNILLSLSFNLIDETQARTALKELTDFFYSKENRAA